MGESEPTLMILFPPAAHPLSKPDGDGLAFILSFSLSFSLLFFFFLLLSHLNSLFLSFSNIHHSQITFCKLERALPAAP